MAKGLRRPAGRLLIVDGHRKREFYGDLLDALETELHLECRPVSPPELFADDLDADLVLVNDESWSFCGAGIAGLRRRGIPALHLADGILEWRNTWENPTRSPRKGGLPLFQPVLADKIACLGRAQARVLEFWGNGAKCEITGSPRFDGLAERPERSRRNGEPARILIATARTPGFTQAQTEEVRRALGDIAEWFSRQGSSYRPIWRVAPEVADVVDGAGAWEGVSLWEQLHGADALITTPSTVQLEGMKAGIPVALLDYGNRPAFVPAAWSIAGAPQIDETIRSLCSPEPQRLSHQQMILHDNLECRTPATPRVVHLVEAMIAAARKSRANGTELALPGRIVPVDPPPVRSASMAELHPDHTVFSETDIASLQAEVGHLRRAMRLSWTQTLYRALCRWEARWSAGAKRGTP